MHNLYKTNQQILGVSMNHLRDRLDALTLVLKTCKGNTCTNPWKALHPDGGVKTLKDALAPRYDTFYAMQPKVKFHHCAKGYIKANESPNNFNVFGQGQSTLRRMSLDASEQANWLDSQIEDRGVMDGDNLSDLDDFAIWG